MGLRYRLKTRGGHAIMYLFMCLAGISSILFPAPSVNAVLPQWQISMWSAFFLVGGAFCLFGVLKGLVVGEIIGLPFPSASLSIYGVVLINVFIQDKSRGSSLFLGMLLLSFAAGLIGRWIESLRILRISRETDS